MTTAIDLLLDAATLTLVLALAAFGLAIIFGLVGVINLGHGAMLTLGAYLTWYAASKGVPFFLAVVLAGAGVGIIGLVFEWALVRHFYDRPFQTLLITWGFFLVVTELIKIVFGTDIHSVHNPFPDAFQMGSIGVPQYQVFLSAVALALMLATAALLYRTDFGIRVRAMIQDRDMASLLGVNASLMYRLVFVVGACLAGIAGGLISPIVSIDPYFGTLWLVRSFFVVIVGGVGQILGGTLLGSFVIGGSETIFSLFAKQVVAETIVFALAVVILRFRPTGILGRR